MTPREIKVKRGCPHQYLWAVRRLCPGEVVKGDVPFTIFMLHLILLLCCLLDVYCCVSRQRSHRSEDEMRGAIHRLLV